MTRSFLFCSMIMLFLSMMILLLGFSNENLVSMISHTLLGIYGLIVSYLFFKRRNETKKERMQKWEETRKKGIVFTILFNGVLGFGVPAGFANWTLTLDNDAKSPALLASIGFAIYILTGAIIGWFIWANMEREYELTVEARIEKCKEKT